MAMAVYLIWWRPWGLSLLIFLVNLLTDGEAFPDFPQRLKIGNPRHRTEEIPGVAPHRIRRRVDVMHEPIVELRASVSLLE